MTHSEFMEIVKHRLDECRAVLDVKGVEYANNKDRLLNFKDGAAFLPDERPTQTKACWSYMTKHLASVKRMVMDETPVNEYMLKEKIGDIINYALLLEACLREDYNLKLRRENEEE